MTLAQRKENSNAFSAEYSVYIFRGSANKQEGQTDWERKTITQNKIRALAKAKKLYASNDYERVEVKRKLLSERYGVNVDKSFRVFKKREWKIKKLSRVAALIWGVICGVALSAAAFLQF